MDINRNQYFLGGLVLLLLGLQFHLTDSMVLTPKCTAFLAKHTGRPAGAVSKAGEVIAGMQGELPPRTVRPPEWLGWALLSLGSVLVLHSFAMTRPE